MNSSTPFQDALDLLQSHDGMRFEAVKDMVHKMSTMDLHLISDFCSSEIRYRRDAEVSKLKEQIRLLKIGDNMTR